MNFKRNIIHLFAYTVFMGALLLKPEAASAGIYQKEISGVEVIDKFISFINEAPAYQIDFVFIARDASLKELSRIRSNVKVQGECFILVNESIEIYCDGLSKWIINDDAGEVNILKNSPESEDISENPISFLNNLKKDYTVQKKVLERSIRGKSTYLVQLTTLKPKSSSVKKIFLTIDGTTGSPISIDLHSSNGNIYTVSSIEFTHLKQGVKPEEFKPAQSRLKGLYINDLR